MEINAQTAGPLFSSVVLLKDNKPLSSIIYVNTETKECKKLLNPFTDDIQDIICDRLIMCEDAPGLNNDTRKEVEASGIEILPVEKYVELRGEEKRD